MFEKYKFLVEKGISEMIAEKIGDYILVYGGNNFPDGVPPDGKKKIYNKMYLFDQNFNLIKEKSGKIFANGGVAVSDENKIWYFLNSTVYLIELVDDDIVESEFFKLDFELNVNFACKYGDDLVFGSKNMYKLSVVDKTLTKLKQFPSEPRNQPVFAHYGDYLYVFGGASNICHLDAYKFDLKDNVWHRLEDIEVSFTGSASCKYDDNRLLVIGGFNKEVYDKAVINLSNIDYKRDYFKKDREQFKWNKKYYIFDFKTEKFSSFGDDINSATCGSGLVKSGDYFYLIGGELKPAFRNPYIYRMKTSII